MGYVEQVLQPGERVLARATLHWVIYFSGLVVLAAGGGIAILARPVRGLVPLLDIVALVPVALGLVLILRAWFRWWGTEIAVTDHRVIYKSGIISRRTVEMNVEQIESVEVDQSVLGRMLGYGDIAVHGTGEGMENIRLIADPLTLRSAITAR
jgi:uncharacterized membrane protein YdbT with pleckstrin-like domain